jgi:hypothetical protein
VHKNKLQQLPSPLPLSLVILGANDNQLTHLPTLPFTLHSLQCNFNKLVALPELEGNLKILHCAHNTLDVGSLVLPLSLEVFQCSYNNNNNKMGSTLNIDGCVKLRELDCSHVHIAHLPASISILRWAHPSNTTLPTLPSSLQVLSLRGWHGVLPLLPSSLRDCELGECEGLPQFEPSKEEYQR